MSDYIGKADVDDGLLVCHFCERLNASVFVSCRSGFSFSLSFVFSKNYPFQRVYVVLTWYQNTCCN
jgi:hypothetical protein